MAIDGPLTHILHFASPASPKDYAQHPIHTLKVGALGAYHVLGLAKDKGAFKVDFRRKSREDERSYSAVRKEFGLDKRKFAHQKAPRGTTGTV